MSSLSAPRKQAARLPRPAARYWKGKAPKGADVPSDSDEEDEDEDEVQVEQEGDVPIVEEDEDEGGLEVREVKATAIGKGRGINVALRDVNISKEGTVTVAGKAEVGRTEAEIGACHMVATFLCTYSVILDIFRGR